MEKISPTERELQILKILWDRPDSTVREVLDKLNRSDKELDPTSPDLAYTSVLTHLQTMERKRLVSHDADGKAYRYRARLKKEPVLGNLARTFLHRLFNGAMDEMLVSMVAAENLSDEELHQLERRINELKRTGMKEGSEKNVTN